MAMVCRGIDGIDANSVDAQLFEVRDITVTGAWLGKAVKSGNGIGYYYY
jgi:hypothetical protein